MSTTSTRVTTACDATDTSRAATVREPVPPDTKSMTYLITFVCYGCHLHGAKSSSVDREHSVPGTPKLEANPTRAQAEIERMNQPPYTLDQNRRDVVLQAIQEVCANRCWSLLAAHVRSTQVHTVIGADVPPERVMVDLKAYASRRLNHERLDTPDRKRWARHGSTRWLWKPQHVAAAVQYVISKQGDAMSLFVSHER